MHEKIEFSHDNYPVLANEGGMKNSFETKDELHIENETYHIHHL